MKSQTAFNFNNISQSLYDLYMSHLGRGSMVKGEQDGGANPGHALASLNVDRDMAQRMMLVKRSKSSLLIPLLVPFYSEFDDDYQDVDRVPQMKLIGSLELYRFHFQPFDEELERRICTFAKILANDVFPVYFSLR